MKFKMKLPNLPLNSIENKKDDKNYKCPFLNINKPSN